MWDQLKAQESAWVGGTLTDVDAPDEPTSIVGFEVTPDTFAVIGKDFTWRANRKYAGVDGPASRDQSGLAIRGIMGMGCTIRKPEASR